MGQVVFSDDGFSDQHHQNRVPAFAASSGAAGDYGSIWSNGMTPTTPTEAREIVTTKLFFPNGDTGYALKSLADQVEELTKERDALAADAERYRWMTEHIVSGDMDSLEKAFAKLDPYGESVTQAEFDAVIDSAIQAGVQ